MDSSRSSLVLSLSLSLSLKLCLVVVFDWWIDQKIWSQMICRPLCAVVGPFMGLIEALIFSITHCFGQRRPRNCFYYSFDDGVRLASTTPCAPNSLLMLLELFSVRFVHLFLEWAFGDLVLICLQLLSMKSRHCASCIKSWVVLWLTMVSYTR